MVNEPSETFPVGYKVWVLWLTAFGTVCIALFLGLMSYMMLDKQNIFGLVFFGTAAFPFAGNFIILMAEIVRGGIALEVNPKGIMLYRVSDQIIPWDIVSSIDVQGFSLLENGRHILIELKVKANQFSSPYLLLNLWNILTLKSHKSKIKMDLGGVNASSNEIRKVVKHHWNNSQLFKSGDQLTDLGKMITPMGRLWFRMYSDTAHLPYENAQLIKMDDPEVKLLEGDGVDGVSLYKVLVSGPIKEAVLHISFEDICRRDAYPESGEYYDSWRIIGDEMQMNVGTHDGDWLDQTYPERHRLGYDDGWKWVAYDNNKGGFIISVPNLLEGEELTYWVATAWKAGTDEEDISTWAAADLALPNNTGSEKV